MFRVTLDSSTRIIASLSPIEEVEGALKRTGLGTRASAQVHCFLSKSTVRCPVSNIGSTQEMIEVSPLDPSVESFPGHARAIREVKKN